MELSAMLKTIVVFADVHQDTMEIRKNLAILLKFQKQAVDQTLNACIPNRVSMKNA